MNDPIDTKAEAQRRLHRALALIASAKRNMDEACSELSGLVGAVRDYEEVAAQSDRVGALWHRVAGLRHASDIDLDETEAYVLRMRAEAKK